ncbi:SDR family oxidoreductase [Salinispirillum sp. LH 10-3-1]|uniref:Dihydromonapterin reductase n=1 Tax=Salinispirillum sp. LH 10-3-1 TaxID=2952525 RepID=A0AB38YK64_9GAMM
MVVVITGVGRRLGLALAQHFLAQGDQVVGTFRSHYPELEELRAQGADITELELTDLTAVQHWATQKAEKYPSIDVLIHNASAFKPTADNHVQGLSDLALFTCVHMQVPYVLNEVFSANLRASTQRHGNIIHITDIYVKKPNPTFSLYCASKAGLQSLNDSYAQTLAPDVRVNAIQPGPLAFLPEHSEAAKEKVLAATPLATLGGFEPVVQAVDFILSNDYLTGASLAIDGGRSLRI